MQVACKAERATMATELEFSFAAPNVDLQLALAKAQWANAMGLAVGVVLGGILPDLLGSVAERLGSGPTDLVAVAAPGCFKLVHFRRRDEQLVLADRRADGAVAALFSEEPWQASSG